MVSKKLEIWEGKKCHDHFIWHRLERRNAVAQQRAVNLVEEQYMGIRTHFEHDWRTLAAINPAYRSFVEQEIARLGYKASSDTSR